MLRRGPRPKGLGPVLDLATEGWVGILIFDVLDEARRPAQALKVPLPKGGTRNEEHHRHLAVRKGRLWGSCIAKAR